MIMVTESDLLAFVDDRLPQQRRRQVAEHLAHCPADARRVAADIAVLEGLRRLFGGRWRGIYTSFLA